jgi:hypothetical protein
MAGSELTEVSWGEKGRKVRYAGRSCHSHLGRAIHGADGILAAVIAKDSVAQIG